jgi:hypothetical protein
MKPEFFAEENEGNEESPVAGGFQGCEVVFGFNHEWTRMYTNQGRNSMVVLDQAYR